MNQRIHHGRDWTDKELTRLTQLWIDPANTASAIGRALHRTPSSIVGKVHRLGLPGRPSPIVGRSSYAPRPSRAIRSGPITLAPLPALVTPEPPQNALQSAGEPAEVEMARKAREPVQSVPKRDGDYARPMQRLVEGGKACCYPTNNGVLPNGKKGWLFCDEPASRLGYCAEHYRVCYHPAPRRDAA